MAAYLALVLGHLLSQFYRTFLAVIAPDIKGELAMTSADLGQASAWFFAVFALAQLWIGPALDRQGPRRTVALHMSVAVAGALAFAMAGNALQCKLAMVLIGLGCASNYMAALYVIGRTYPQERFGLLSSWFLGLASLGVLASSSPLALLIERIGWRGALVVLAAATAASAIVILVLVRDPPPVVTARGSDRGGLLAGYGEVLAIRPLWALMPIAAVALSVVTAERGLWAGPFLAEVHRLDLVPRGEVLLAMSIAMTVGALVYGPIDRLLGRRKWIVLAANATLAGLLLALSRLGPSDLSTTTHLLIAIGIAGSSGGILWAHIRALLPSHILGRGMTLMNLLVIGGIGVLQLASGTLVEHWTTAGQAPHEVFSQLHLLFAVCILLAITVYAFSHEPRVGHVQQCPRARPSKTLDSR